MNWIGVLTLVAAVTLGYLAVTGRYAGVWSAIRNVPAAPSSIASNTDTINSSSVKSSS